jgi:FMN-dependent NADH-azoreductase
MDGEITEVNLYKEGLLPLCNKGIEKRAQHDISGEEFDYARQFSKADVIVIGAPFWDLSFPAALKLYFENVTVSGITFEYSDKGRPVSKCNAKELYYITTSGGYIGNNNFGFDYVKALAENFFGINDISFYSAEGLDIMGADVKSIMNEAKGRIADSHKN